MHPKLRHITWIFLSSGAKSLMSCVLNQFTLWPHEVHEGSKLFYKVNDFRITYGRNTFSLLSERHFASVGRVR